MTKSYDIEETLPRRVEVPVWITAPDKQAVVTQFGTLNLQAMNKDDVLVEGTFTYGGHQYEIRYRHTNIEGLPKGYFYRGREGQVYDVLIESDVEGMGTSDLSYSRQEWFSPRAPKTYAVKFLEEVRVAVLTYLRAHPQHVQASLAAYGQQNLARQAGAYNDLAEAAAGALKGYDDLLAEVSQ